MPGQESQELQSYLDGLIAVTRAGSVQWTSANPTTFIWQTENARFTVQRVEKTGPVVLGVGRISQQKKISYVFQAHELVKQAAGGGLTTLQQRFSIEGSENEELNRKLDELFDAIRSGIFRKGLEFLKEHLPTK